ncbi:MAG: hypothetical protein U5J97_04175 [Trueperaceae bacterium]|nr:hypothetical protein [Trueperaceae bacterium]
MPFLQTHSTRAPRRTALVVVLALSVLAPGQAAAQTLAEVTFVAATATTLNPAIRLPSGSLRAVGPGVDALLARLPDASAWTEPEAYVARGIASRLRPAFEQQVVTGFAAAGFFEASRRTVPDGAGTRTRIEFEGPGGERALLVLFDVPEEVTWLVARSR